MKPAASLRSHSRGIALAWAALLALMLASLGSAYLDLGLGNLAAGLAIAFVKAAIVLWLFMRLRASTATVRLVAATALATLLLLFALGSVDYATRRPEPADYQAPRQARRSADSSDSSAGTLTVPSTNPSPVHAACGLPDRSVSPTSTPCTARRRSPCPARGTETPPLRRA